MNSNLKTKTQIILSSAIFLATLAGTRAQTTFTQVTTGDIVNDGGESFACAWGDYDNDGFLDLFVANTDDHNNFLYHNNRDGTFTRITVGAIANEIGGWQGCAWADYDNDGNLDVIVIRQDEAVAQAVLYRNNGDGTFTRLPDDTIGGVVGAGAGNSVGPAWADYDNDGFVDVFVNRFGIDWLYHNNGNGGFTSVTNNLVGTSNQGGFTAAWADYNNDGKQDLLVVVATDPPTRRLYKNLGEGSFAQVPSGSIVTGNAHGGAAWADYDNDGFPDLFVAAGNTGESNCLYHNNGDGTFTSMTSNVVGSIVGEPGIFDQCAWGDYDNDGFIDLFVTTTAGLENNSGGNALYHNNGDGTFTRIHSGSPADDIANSVGCAWGDYDNDGFLDLFVANGGVVQSENNFLFHNNGNTNNWLKIKCVGTVSNRSAIGAKVRAKATIRGKTFWQLREISGGTGVCQNALEAHFGLGDATNVDLVRIEWPSGIVQEFHDVAAKQFLTIREPPRLQALGRLGDGSFQLSLTGGLGFTYNLENSTDLTHWTLLTTLTNTNRTMTITDTTAPNSSQRFYRAVSR